MTLSDIDEALPLLHNKRKDKNVSNNPYRSLFNSNKDKSCIISERELEDNAETSLTEDVKQYQNESGFWSRRTDAPSLDPSQFHSPRMLSSVQKISYSWKNINVYDSIENKEPSSVWKKAGYSVKRRDFHSGNSKHILKDVYGIAHAGEFLAIMGSSGAGKTTLLNTLRFQSEGNRVVKGFRYLNGCLINNRSAVAGLSAYVEQDNLFLGTLTVREHLIFQSLVRMDRNITYRQRLKRVDEVMTELALLNCKNTVIGCAGRTKGLSGGEIKRLAIASEVLTNPPILFGDEPTSGLDSFIALNVITFLKSLTIRGKTIICTIHQPSSEIFSLFDKILLLAEGRTAFQGTPNDAIHFFAELGASPPLNYNPADFFIQLLSNFPSKEEACQKTVEFICDSFDQSPYGLEITTQIECGSKIHDDEGNNPLVASLNEYQRQFAYKATWFVQFRALFWRSWLSIIKEPLLAKVRLFQTVVLSLVVGVIYHQQKLNEEGVMNINGVLFTFITNMTFQNLFAVISVFCSELPIFMKEHSNKLYRVDAYFLAKTLAEIPMFLVIPTIFTSITYYWIGLNPGLYHFTAAIAILILITNVATSFGYLISCISTNVVMALSVGPPLIIPFLLFGGFLLNSGATPSYFKWLSYFSWFKYGNEALLTNQWSDVTNIECSRSNVTCPKNGKIVLEIYNFDEHNFMWDIISLLLLIFFFRLLAFLGLVLRTISYKCLLRFN